MKLSEHVILLDRLDGLIRRKQTGTPKELAIRLDVSERTVYRFINELRELGLPVRYCSTNKSYMYHGQYDGDLVKRIGGRNS